MAALLQLLEYFRTENCGATEEAGLASEDTKYGSASANDASSSSTEYSSEDSSDDDTLGHASAPETTLTHDNEVQDGVKAEIPPGSEGTEHSDARKLLTSDAVEEQKSSMLSSNAFTRQHDPVG